MPVPATDEGLHPAGDDIDWQESVYLAWRDPIAGLGGNHRIGNELNRETANLWCGVYADDGVRFRHNGEGLGLERLDTHGLVAGPQRLFHDGSGLRFVLDGDGCTLDFTISDDEDSLAETGGEAFSSVILSKNYHSFCRVRGTATLGGRQATVDGWAWRDHSWGARRWDSFLASRSFGGAAGGLQFRYGSMVGADGSFFRRGSLLRDGKPLEVDGASMLVTMDDDSVRCAGAEVTYALADGGVTRVQLHTIGGMVGATRERFGWEAVGDAEVEGERGWAFLEVNNNPRAGSAPPIVVLGEGLTNGVVRSGR